MQCSEKIYTSILYMHSFRMQARNTAKMHFSTAVLYHHPTTVVKQKSHRLLRFEFPLLAGTKVSWANILPFFLSTSSFHDYERQSHSISAKCLSATQWGPFDVRRGQTNPLHGGRARYASWIRSLQRNLSPLEAQGSL